jgi:hypothetical protein
VTAREAYRALAGTSGTAGRLLAYLDMSSAKREIARHAPRAAGAAAKGA